MINKRFTMPTKHKINPNKTGKCVDFSISLLRTWPSVILGWSVQCKIEFKVSPLVLGVERKLEQKI